MKKIMFTDKYGLTDAVLEGRKMMTRRLIGKRMTEYDIKAYLNGYTELAGKCAPYKIGEVVAVAQAYKYIEAYNPKSYEDVMLDQGTICESSHPYSHLMKSGGWDNKMLVKADLMPHQIKITDIKVERLQDISYKDCIKEGIAEAYIGYYVKGLKTKDWEKESHVEMDGYTYKLFPTPQKAFAALIDKVSGKGTWNLNPFVFAYTFEIAK